jgi:phytanoyl-CoA hydroxylase
MTTMTNQNLETYERDGYLVFPSVYSPSDLAPFKRVIDRAVDTHARALLAQGKITDLHEDLPLSGGWPPSKKPGCGSGMTW